jgi:hypothetical protein
MSGSSSLPGAGNLHAAQIGVTVGKVERESSIGYLSIVLDRRGARLSGSRFVWAWLSSCWNASWGRPFRAGCWYWTRPTLSPPNRPAFYRAKDCSQPIHKRFSLRITNLALAGLHLRRNYWIRCNRHSGITYLTRLVTVWPGSARCLCNLLFLHPAAFKQRRKMGFAAG